MPSMVVCPHCGEHTFYETPTGRRCRSCGFTVKRPANSGAGGKGRYCYICGKYQVFHGKCRSCGAKESFTCEWGEIYEMEKCKSCPYRLGLIKCIINPCVKCILTKWKTNPFRLQDNKKHSQHPIR